MSSSVVASPNFLLIVPPCAVYFLLSFLLSTTVTGTSTSSVDPSLYWINTLPVVSPTFDTSGTWLHTYCFTFVSWSLLPIPSSAFGSLFNSVTNAFDSGDFAASGLFFSASVLVSSPTITVTSTSCVESSGYFTVAFILTVSFLVPSGRVWLSFTVTTGWVPSAGKPGIVTAFLMSSSVVCSPNFLLIVPPVALYFSLSFLVSFTLTVTSTISWESSG